MVIALRLLAAINTLVLRLFRQLGWMALALMVVVILVQVFFRYVLNNALAWPDEAARFLMLWMVAFLAPSAMRWNGFVAIDMLHAALPRRAGLVLSLVLLGLSLLVLVEAIGHGINHTFGFGGNFDSSSLRLPLDMLGFESIRVKLRYMYGALLVCVITLASVTVELILRSLVELLRPGTELPSLDQPANLLGSAE
ncbi:MAG: TRAP transporter small permease subunit [Alphaproteobacteria bacterium]|nr:MAG: TRAP transporter small permease subunit [Alphaproteobacteria bacterium]